MTLTEIQKALQAYAQLPADAARTDFPCFNKTLGEAGLRGLPQLLAETFRAMLFALENEPEQVWAKELVAEAKRLAAM